MPRTELQPSKKENGPSAIDEGMPRMERVLASARLFLATTCLVAIYLDPTQPTRYATWAYILLIGYVFYSFSLLVLIFFRKREELTPPFILVMHGVDLLWPAVLSLFTEGAESPFSLFFLFVLMSAAYRWGFWETVATTGIAIFLLSMQPVLVSSGPADTAHLLLGQFELNRFIMRMTYLCLMGLLMGYLGEEERRLRLEASAVARIITKVQAERGLVKTLRVVLHEALQLFGAHEALLLVTETPNGRTFLWQTRKGQGKSGEALSFRELGSWQRETYLFDLPCHSLRATHGGATGQGGSLRVFGLDRAGQRIRSRSCSFPADFVSAHVFRTVLVVSVAFADEWSGRLFVFKSEDGILKERHLLFLQTLAHRVAPAVYNAYLAGRIRAEAEEAERARLARELHDGVVQFLTGLGLNMEAVRRQTPTAPPRMMEEIVRLQQLIGAEVVNLRDLMRRLRPIDISPQQLGGFLRDTVERFQLETGIRATFFCDFQDAQMPRRACRELAQIAQEALVNVRKHSEARNVAVQLTTEGSCWKLLVKDDGRGFDFAGRLSRAELDNQHKGPRIIKERVASLKGELTIESAPGGGACLEVSVPRS